MIKIHMRKITSPPAVAAGGGMSWRDLLLLASTLLFGTMTDAFVPSSIINRNHHSNGIQRQLFQQRYHHHRYPSSSSFLQAMMIPPDSSDEKNNNLNDNNSDNNDNIIKTHVVASDALILPGEGMTLFMTNGEAFPLVQNCLNGGSDDECHRQVVVAVRLMTGEMGEIASLCEINEIKFGSPNDYVQVDLQCTGQVKLLQPLAKYNPDHFLFRVECGVDATFTDEADLEVAIEVQEEIDALMRHISEMEDQIQQELCEHHRQSDAPHSLRPQTCFMPPIPLIDQYEAAKANVQQACMWNYKPPTLPPSSSTTTAAEAEASTTAATNRAAAHDTTITDHNEDDRMLRLTATSWGVFLCLNDPKLESRYRNKLPLQLLDRIKLAQYALREKQLYLQGQLLQLKQQEEEEADDDDDCLDGGKGGETTSSIHFNNNNNINYRGMEDDNSNNDSRLRENYFDDMDVFQ